ncbi:MAG: undecaprenyl-diphosphatase UppP [Caldilineaceae bacterium]|nr:undecaprenyl-diphosphatase UppP [Caldilineaceae bacterium]MBP8107719.1 undecaprenyl-diphosphatase UppP [Caldilineaceae bacterium]MBP8122862.1 undecaprenyl-diphosphatase UppP [Caldilineaceae bacterium]MBP9071256.1 undecaprenyl-diphosphatase UppP [Caldilineaceae bacterium]
MSIWQSIVMGIIQGLTEFLPISSSGHLVIIPHLLGWQFPEQQTFVFDVLVQWGTLLAVILFYWSDLWRIVVSFVQALIARKPFGNPDARMGWYLILATIPAVLLGLLFKDTVAVAFTSVRATAGFLLLTALILVVAELAGKRHRSFEEIGWKDALWIGAAQVISLLPGVSRSGSTMAGAMTRDLDRPAAARFSFLMSIPVMLGAGVLAMKDLVGMADLSAVLPPLLVGFVTAFIFGYVAIRWLIGYLTRHSLYAFAAYCTVVGLLVLVIG